MFAGQFVDVGENFGDGGVEFLGDFLADFDHAVDGAGQRRTLDDRNAGVGSHLADAQGHEIVALGDDFGGAHFGLLVFQGDGKMGGVGDDHIGVGNFFFQSLHGALEARSGGGDF